MWISRAVTGKHVPAPHAIPGGIIWPTLVMAVLVVALVVVAALTGLLEEVAEPFLVRLGFLMRTPRGRVATERGWQHLGMQPPQDRTQLF